jgi:putative transcriptional regulator
MNVTLIRQSLGLSQQDFAERYGFPLATLRNWEHGRREPSQNSVKGYQRESRRGRECFKSKELINVRKT